MPILEAPHFKPPLLFRQKDIHTVVPALSRRVKHISYKRFRLELKDGDFLDLDFSSENTGNRPILVITHGLEGHSGSRYVKGIARAANQNGYDSVALNLRGCSGETNRLYISYHSGKTDDLDHTINYLIDDLGYESVLLNGFSLGGNLSLMYAGERGDSIRSEIKGLVAVSVPTDLAATCKNLQRRRNWIYLKNFMITLRKKAIMKAVEFPEQATYSPADARKARNFVDYDSLYTAPAHGFKDAADYYNSCSSQNFLHSLRIPTLLINALDDPFLTPKSFPYAQAENHEFFHFMTPRYGGHVGFIERLTGSQTNWVEDRIIEFLAKV